MTANGSIPGPTLRLTKDAYAVIYVRNHMDVETSVHWHGILLPNFHDGVPYLATPPIRPGQTLTYEFPVKQAGTWAVGLEYFLSRNISLMGNYENRFGVGATCPCGSNRSGKVGFKKPLISIRNHYENG